MKKILQTEEHHVHVYYELHQIMIANDDRDKLIREIAQIKGVGPLRKKSGGFHPILMFEVWFSHQLLNTVFEWMKQNSGG